ncbi:MAG: hypothetical protein A2270_00180 [Elusimicrobia bacterium RIFOXYA12_FULL_51_18]|nr:MAG: hypothetical protein A2270_00180 [Elusimicrobia bacterium RIFOXYA12_FULL_51_18]OGS31513.1 MAG: hypothetical protein A2218_09650 [Elusimicrobia bacterium RIFOXYA2_FULL_53_38]
MKNAGATLKETPLYEGILRLNIWLVFAALLVNISIGWKSFPGPSEGEAAAYRVYGWAYGRGTEAIGIREPAPVFPVRVLKRAGVPVPLGAKIIGVSAFAGLTWLTLVFLRRRYGAVAGAIGAMLLSVNPYFCYYAVRGPAEIFSLLFFLAFWYFVEKKDFAFKNLAAAAACAALAALSKIIFLVFVPATLGLWILEERSVKRVRFALYSALLACALVSPYLIYQNSVFGRPLSLQENLLRQWRNLALEGPILEAPFNGGPLSPSEFMFGEGTRRSAAWFAAGLRKIFLSGLPELAYYRIELFFGLMGLVLLYMKKSRSFASLFFLFILPVAFIAAVNQVMITGGIEPRFYLGAFWLVCAYAGFGFQELLVISKQLLLAGVPSPASKK